MDVLLTVRLDDGKIKAIEQLGYNVTVADEKNNNYPNDVEKFDALICHNPFNNISLEKFKGLKWIHVLSSGTNHVPVEILRKKNILLSNNRGGYSIPVSEWIIFSILQIYKNSLFFMKNKVNKEWKVNRENLELFGKEVAFFGTGSIAIETANRLKNFGVKLTGINTSGRLIEPFDYCYKINDVNDHLSNFDIIILTLPYTKKTHHIIDFNKMSLMKRTAAIVNVSRGGILDEKALKECLDNGKFSGIALDVFEEEPLSKNNTFWENPKVIITPHNAWVSENSYERRFNILYNNLKCFRNNEEIVNIVDLKKDY